MKNVILFICIMPLLIQCKVDKKETNDMYYNSFGQKITKSNAISKEKMAEKFNTLSDGDTISAKFISTINEVCIKKGCWMKLDLGNNKESMVRFKDYGFFVPKDANNKEVVVEGKAYVTKISVDQLKHYAKDGGKSDEEIEAIKEPEFTYAFEAHGVLLKK